MWKNFESLDFDHQGVYCYLNSPNAATGVADIAHPDSSKPQYSRLMPSKFMVEALIASHESCGHSGVKNTINYCRLGRVFFPNMASLAESVVRTCKACQYSAGRPQPQRAIYRWKHTGLPWHTLSIHIGMYYLLFSLYKLYICNNKIFFYSGSSATESTRISLCINNKMLFY